MTGQPAYGACSDTTHARNSTAGNVALRACSIKNGVVTVEWKRPIRASDKWDRSWPTGAGKYFVHAIGPLAPSSTISRPVLWQHFDITPVSPCACSKQYSEQWNCDHMPYTLLAPTNRTGICVLLCRLPQTTSSHWAQPPPVVRLC
jgi:hypothetical protein